MRLRLLLAAGLALGLVACHSKEAPAPAASAGLPEAPAPAALIAELSVGDPKQTWQRARLLGGDYAQALPTSLAVLLATSLSLPPAVAGNLDESVPFVGVVLARNDAPEPDVVIGVHVLSGVELVASLTLGDGAKFRRLDLGPRVVRLVSAPGAVEFDGALGVSGNYLLLATQASALSDAARFVAESVPKRARREPGLTVRATASGLTGALTRRLRDGWQVRRAELAARDRAERDAKGRAPDFADPQVLLTGADNTIESWLAVLESSRDAVLTLTPEADRLSAELLLTPNTDGAAALLARELVVGSASPLLQLPSSTAAALLMRGEPQPNAAGPGASVAQLFGGRLTTEQTKQMVKAFDELAKARRGATVLGFVPTPAPALLVTCELSPEGAFNDAVANVLALLQLLPVRGLVAGTLGQPSLELTRSASGIGHARLRFRSTGRGPALPVPKSLSVSWEARDGVGYIVVSPDDAVGLTPFAEKARLGSSEWLTRSQPALADSRALGLFADVRLVAPGGPDEAKVLLSFGKNGDQIAIALDVAANALPALARVLR